MISYDQSKTCSINLLTICLPPCQIVSEILVPRIQDNTPIKCWGVLHRLCVEISRPIEDIGGGEQTDHITHYFTENRKIWLFVFLIKNSCINVYILNKEISTGSLLQGATSAWQSVFFLIKKRNFYYLL